MGVLRSGRHVPRALRGGGVKPSTLWWIRVALQQNPPAMAAPWLTGRLMFLQNAYTRIPQIEFPLATEIQENAFRVCQSLSDVVLPAVTSIADNAFFEAFAAEPLVLELAHLTKLGELAFSRSNLAGISAPALTAIPKEAFAGKSAY